MARRKLWHSKLTKAEKNHLKEDAGCNLVSIEPFKKTIKWQRENDARCIQCELIARKLAI
jgi:hypothetical protein